MDINMVMYPEITGGKGDTDGEGNNNQKSNSQVNSKKTQWKT